MSHTGASAALYPTIAFLTDFGVDDGYVGVMKGVVLRIVPQVHLVDITHRVPPQHVSSGAWILATSYRYFPPGTICVCVVDPGVGSTRRPIGLHAGEWFFVGPDNGLFSYVMEQETIHEVVALSNPQYHLTPVSNTFHGRDIFAPSAAYLARGIALPSLGSLIDPATLHRLDVRPPLRQGQQIDGRVLHIDRFGNLITNIPLQLVPELPNGAITLLFPTQQLTVTEYRRFFSGDIDNETDVMQPFIYGDSSGHLAVAIRNANAAHILQVGYDDRVVLTIDG